MCLLAVRGGYRWEGWSLSLEAFTEPCPGLEPPGLLGKDLVSPSSTSWQGGGRRPESAVELLVFGPSQSLGS